MPFVLVAVFGDLAWAVLSLLLAIAIYLISRAIAATIPSFPIIGNVIADAFTKTGDFMAQYVTNSGHTWWPRITNLIRADRWILLQLQNGVSSVLVHLGDLIAHHNNVTIPQAADDARNDSFNHADTLSHSLQDNLDRLTDTEHANVASLQNNIDGLRNYIDGPFHNDIDNAIVLAEGGAVQQAEQIVNSLVSNLSTRLGSDETLLTQLDVLVTHAVPAEIAAEVGQAAAQLRSETSAVVASLQGDIARAEDSLRQAITAGNNALTATLSGNIDQLQLQIDSIVGKEQIDAFNIGTLNNDVAVVIPAAIAAVAARVASITTEYERCAVTTCEGPNNISSLLNNLLGLGGEAELLAFLAAAIHDPTGEARAFSSIAEGFYNEGHALIDGLLSI